MSQLQHRARRVRGQPQSARAVRFPVDRILALGALLMVGVSGYGLIMMAFAAFQLSA